MMYAKIMLLVATLLAYKSDKIELTKAAFDKKIRYLALGDSYTIGESVETENNYPHLLEKKLINAGILVEETKIIAKTGWKTDDLMNAIKKEKLTGTFDIVTLLIGVNNQYQHKPIEQYKTEFRVLLNTAIELAGGNKNHVHVISIPDYGFTPFGIDNKKKIGNEIDVYNKINKEISSELGVKRFDITPISRKAIKRPELVAKDGLHPSAIMYQEWVDLFGDKIISSLK